MKMQFSFVIEVGDDAEKRFIDKMNKMPNMQMNIIQGFGNLISLALDATPADNLSLIGFNAGRINEDQQPSETSEKKE